MSKLLSVLSGIAVIVLLMVLGGTLISLADSESQADRVTFSSVGTAFTYQGYLTEGQNPANGPFDLAFSLYDDRDEGNQVGTTISRTAIITDGLLAVDLDFGSVFDGTALWLQIGVRPSGDTGLYDPLRPRQRLMPTPFATYASRVPWAGLTDLPAGFGDGIDDDTLISLGCATGEIAKWNGAAWACGTDELGAGGSAWLLTGNAGTAPGTDFLGTTDDQALEFHVNQSRALRLEPNEMSPNVLGGYSGNSIGVRVDGATIGGGGRDPATNQVTASFGTIGGGAGNVASGYAATIDGGEGNHAGGAYATAGGGYTNTVSGDYATIGGGASNAAENDYATVGGGISNEAGANFAAIGGGANITITANYGAAAGGRQNSVAGTAAAIGGGDSNAANGNYAAVGGGQYNLVAATYGTVAGGGPSDPENPTTTSIRVFDDYGTVGGGGGNVAGGDDGNPTTQTYATVGGGASNAAGDDYATVSGGSTNTAGGYAATVGGGLGNAASNQYTTVGGGTGNTASNRYATVSGGYTNTVSAVMGAIGGGYDNMIAGSYGTIPGGAQNHVGGTYGFAAGRLARAEHQASFVWSDSSSTPFASTGPDQFLISAAGGVGIGTNAPSHMLTVAGSAAIQSSAVISVGAIVSYPTMLQAPRALYAVGDLLYAAGYATNTLSIWNVTDPPNHTLIGYTTFQLQGPVDLQVVGNRAYVASQNRDMLTILDVSDPADPSHVGDTTEYLGRPQGVHVSGKYAYVASKGRSSPAGLYDGLTVFDVTDAPAEIAATSFVTTYLQGTSDVFVSGSYAYVTSRDNNRLVVYDVSDPRHPTPVSYTAESLIEPVRVHVSDVYAYVVTEGANSVVVFDISNPAQIAYVGQVATVLTHPRSLYVSGDRAYVAYAGDALTNEHCGLAVLDLSDPADLSVLNVIDMSDWLKLVKGGTVEEPTWELVPPKPVAVTGSGGRVYVANEQHDSVTVFEIDGLEVSAVRAGEMQVAQLEVDDYAAIEGDLGVRGGLNVGLGGALVQGTLSVEGPGDSYIQGRLGIGPVATVITRSVSPTESEEVVMRHPTHQLDVDGEARFRVNDHNHLVLRSPNTGSDEDAWIDFARFDHTDLLTSSARIEFDAADPFTHSTSIHFHTQGPDDPTMISRLQISEEGHVLPDREDHYTLGDENFRWLRVHALEGVVMTSDARYKDNVSALPYGLDEVTELRPVAFNWIGTPNHRLHYGLIAQEVREVLPDIVSGDDGENGTLGMNYSELVPVLVKAVQEQQEEIDTQAEQIAVLEERLAALEDGQADQLDRPGVLNLLTTFGFGGLALGAMVLVGMRRNGGRS